MADLREKIRTSLKDLPLEESRVEVRGPAHSMIATVVSSSFSGMDEAERQRRVWSALREKLTDDERAAVEFVFTIAPGDHEAANIAG